MDSDGTSLKLPPCQEFELEEGRAPVNVSKAESRQKLNDSHKPAARCLFKTFLSNFTPLIDCVMSAGSQRRVALCSKAANQGRGSLRVRAVEFLLMVFFYCQSLRPLPPFCFLLSKSIRFSLNLFSRKNGTMHTRRDFFYQHIKKSVVSAHAIISIVRRCR